MESIPVSKDGLKNRIDTTGKVNTETTKGIVFLPKKTYKAPNTTIEIKAEGNETKSEVMMNASIASPFPFLKKGNICPRVAKDPANREAKLRSMESVGASKNNRRVGIRIFTPSIKTTLILSLVKV